MKKEKETLLNDLQNLLSNKLKGQSKAKAIEYLEQNKNNFNEENLKEILSNKYIQPNRYKKSEQEFEEIRDKLKNNITKNQQKTKKSFQKSSLMKKKLFQDSSSDDSFQKVDQTTQKSTKKDSMFTDKKSQKRQSQKNSLMKSKVFKNSKKEKNSEDFQLDLSKVELDDQTQFLDNDNLLKYLNDEKPEINKKKPVKKKSQANRNTFFVESDSESRSSNKQNEESNKKNKNNFSMKSNDNSDSSEDKKESKSSSDTDSDQKSNSTIQDENDENNTSIDQNRKSKKEKPKKQEQIINKEQNGNILKCELIYELIEDQSSEQSLQKISFQYKNLLKIEQSKNEKEFEILGFYGQKNNVIQSVEEWLETKIKIDQNKESKFLLFIGKTENKIAAFVIVDDKLFVNPYEKNCHLIDFIKILQDVSSKVRLCLNPNIEINEGDNPFNIKRKGRVIENKTKKQNYKLSITKLEEKNKSQQNNFDKLVIWNQFLVKAEINYIKKNEDRMIEVQEFKQDCFINLGISKKKLIKIENYPKYLKNNINRLTQSKTLTEVANDILAQVEQHIQNKQEKILFQEKFQQILEESKKQEDEPMERILDEKYDNQNEDENSAYQLNYQSFVNIKSSEDVFKEGFQKIIECLEQIQIKKSDEKIQSAIVTLQFYQIGFPQDSNSQISSFQINETNMKGTFLLQEITEKNISIRKLLTFNEKQGLIFISQGNEKTYIILQFSIGENDKVDIQRFQYYPIERQFYVDQQNQNFLILTNEGGSIQINKIEKNFKIQNIKTINGIGKQKIQDQGTQYKIESINQFIFYGKQKKFIFMNQDREIFQTSSNQQKAKIKILKKNVLKDNVTKEQFFRTEDNEFYDQFITSINNNYIILKYKNGIDIYDQNFQFQKKINLEGIFIEAQVIEFNDKQYLIILYKEGLKCYSFEGECNVGKRSHKTLGKEKEKPKGNSSIDYFFSAIKKYGSNAPYQEEVIEKKILQLDKSLLKKLKKYIKKIRYFKDLIKTENISDDIDEKIKWRNFNFMIKTRAPLHIASIEQKQLYPLKNGINNRINIQRGLQQLYQDNNQQEIYFHQQIKVVLDEIKFGVYEDILNEYEFDELKVICTMGRQSLGKSYLLNRLFGTRFNVDSKRCTDGLWLSMSAEEIDDTHILYVIIDCEGLFNIRRVLEEELQLVSVCTGISNLTIFNSENNFDRKLDQFFGQLGKQSIKYGNLKYYQGALLFLIRDIPKSDKDNVLDDFQTNIEQRLIKNQNIEEKTFKKILYDAMTSFENKDDFNEDVEDLKADVITEQIKPNKLNSQSFVQSFKLLLAKIYFNDDQDVDLAVLRMKLDEKFLNSKKMFLEGNEFLNKQKKKLDLKKLLNCEIDVNQRDTNFKNQNWQGEKYYFENKIHPLNKPQHDSFRIIFSKQVKYDIKKHNEWFKSYFLFCETFIKERINIVVQEFKDQFQQEKQYRQEIEQKTKQLEQELSQTLKLYTICQYKGQKCKFCRRSCVQKKNHEGVCNCYTDHSCQEQCSIENCKLQNFQCSKYYGHEDGKHLCNKSNHYCKHQCSIQDCEEQCKLQQEHKSEDHNCQRQHECKQKCSLESCQELCQHSLENKDHKHQCQNYECPFTCELCDKKCIFPDHFHNDYMQQKLKQKLKIDIDGITYKFDHHNCGGEHRCHQLCQQEGICECNYINISKSKNTRNNKVFKYDYTEQTEKRNPCNLQIPKLKKKHKYKHDCEKEQPHRCNNQCPECKIYCELDYGHEGPHQNGLHRNKDNAIYSGMSKDVVIEIKQDDEVYTFNIGDAAENERCMSSCINKGRSHVHLVECEGGQLCHQVQLGDHQARHIDQQLDKEGIKQYDQLLCQAYFDYHNWKPPAEGEEQEKINQCSFACTHYEHKKNNEMVYCQNAAWHEGDHFVGHVHKTVYEKIQVAFILDCTQSMGVYIEGTKKAIDRIIKNFVDKYKEQNKIEFGVVAYKDHYKSQGWDQDRPIKTQEFTNEKQCKEFVGRLKEGGGFDPPEAVVDGFQGVTELAWTEGSLKFVFLVTDGPPHGERFAGNLNDQHPDGCPCNLDFDTIIQVINELNIKFRFVKIGDLVNKFSQFLADNVREYDVLELDENIQLENIVTDSLFEDLKNEYFEIKQQGVIK